MKKKHLWLIAVGGSLICCIAPFILTRPCVWEAFSFADTGQIGDTIGGITAPIIGIISILLLVWTLKAQLDFDQKQASDNLLNQILTLQNDIVNACGLIHMNFTWEDYDKRGEINGIFQINELVDDNMVFYRRDLHYLISQVSIVDHMCIQLIALNNKGALPKELTINIHSLCLEYLAVIYNFYENVAKERIRPRLTIDEIQTDGENLFVPDDGLVKYQQRAKELRELIKQS